MSLISKKDKKFIKFLRSKLNLPDWSLATAIRSYLGLEKMNEGRKIKVIKGTTKELIEWGRR